MQPQYESSTSADSLPADRLIGTLFFMAFGYALVSVCLFRILAFTLSSTAFFVLYVAVSMPLGAYLAERNIVSSLRGLRFSIKALVLLTLMLPLIGWLSTRGPGLIAEPNLLGVNLEIGSLWQLLGYQLVVVCPLFVTWGAAEFIGYQVALGSDSARLRNGFYLIFVWALASALAVGFWAIPQWGWLRTLAFVPVAAAVSHDFLTWTTTKGLRRLAPYVAASLVWMGAGSLERPFIYLLFSDRPFNVGALLTNESLQWGESSPGATTLLASKWGKYSHVALVGKRGLDSTTVYGAYDGTVHWTVNPEKDLEYGVQRAVFDFVPEGADIAILGAGGGRQVAQALDRNPKRVVAVDLVPEVFTLLKGEYAWANGGVYESPRVETVVADGRSYLQSSSEQFDLVLLPNTESFGAVVRAFFEPGQRIHTVEAFALMRSRLKANGVLAIYKNLDRGAKLFNDYAVSLQRAGLQVIGWIHPRRGFPGQPIVLLASPTRDAFESGARARAHFADLGFEFVDFRETAPSGEAIFDDSPWARGVLEMWLPRATLRRLLVGIGAIAAVGVALVLGLSLRRLDPGETIARRALFVLAGVSIGIHAVYLQNGVIFWLLVNLFNPLAAFFLGTSLFLLAWGLSSTMLKRWGWMLLLGAAGIGGALLSRSWHGSAAAVSMACIALGSGLFFPTLGLTFRSRLLNLFIADAMGGFIGGLLGIWLPLLFGFGHYFALLPWVSLSSFVLVGLTVAVGRQPATARVEADESFIQV